MSLTVIAPPYPIFTDLQGKPLDDGSVYIGEASKDPSIYPIQVFWDADLQIPANQPISTINGYPSRRGTPSQIYASTNSFSILTKDKHDAVVMYAPVGYGVVPTAVSGTVTIQRYSGDGSTVVFALPSDPESEDIVSIYIDGIYQQHDTFSISGTALTFSEAPPSGTDNIEVILATPVILGYTETDNINYTATGASTPITLTGRLDSRLTCADFGVSGEFVDNLSNVEGFEGAYFIALGKSDYNDGGEGIFIFDGSDLSTEVAADSYEGIYVAPASDITGASGAWVRQLNGFVTPAMFGAPIDETSDAYNELYAAWSFVSTTDSPPVDLVLDRFYVTNTPLVWTTALRKAFRVRGVNTKIGNCGIIAGASLSSASKPSGLSGTYGSSISMDYVPIITLDNVSRIRLEDFQIDGAGYNVYGIYENESFYNVFKGIRITDCNKAPWTKIRAQQNTYIDCERYGNGQGTTPEATEVWYDTTGIIELNPSWERNGAARYNLEIYQPNNKGGWLIQAPWFEIDSAGPSPALGFLSVGGRNCTINTAHMTFTSIATTENSVHLKNSSDTLSKDGLTMTTYAGLSANIQLNDVSSPSMNIDVSANCQNNKIRGYFNPSLVTDAGTNTQFEFEGLLLPHVLYRFQVRDALGVGSADYIMDVDYNSGTPIIRLFGNANNYITLSSGQLKIASNSNMILDSGGNIQLLPYAGTKCEVALTGGATFRVVNLPTYADNTAALAGGLTASDFYKTATGEVMVVY